MEAITRETFNRWCQKNNWMQVNEAMTPQGRQIQFLTPAGEVVVAMIDLKGNLVAVGKIVSQAGASLPAPPGKGLKF